MSSRPSSVADRPADRTCERCGASFKYPMLLKRRKERKNPCTQPAAIPEEPAAPPAAEAAAADAEPARGRREVLAEVAAGVRLDVAERVVLRYRQVVAVPRGRGPVYGPD